MVQSVLLFLGAKAHAVPAEIVRDDTGLNDMRKRRSSPAIKQEPFAVRGNENETGTQGDPRGPKRMRGDPYGPIFISGRPFHNSAMFATSRHRLSSSASHPQLPHGSKIPPNLRGSLSHDQAPQVFTAASLSCGSSCSSVDIPTTWWQVLCDAPHP